MDTMPKETLSPLSNSNLQYAGTWLIFHQGNILLSNRNRKDPNRIKGIQFACFTPRQFLSIDLSEGKLNICLVVVCSQEL